MTVDKKLIENIQDLKKAINEISVYDLNAYSSLELYSQIARKLNEVIRELLRFEGTVSDEVIEQNNKLIYLLDKGLNIEVFKKINEMIKDGTMDTIINHNVFNNLNSQIKDIENNVDEKFTSNVNKFINNNKRKNSLIRFNFLSSSKPISYLFKGENAFNGELEISNTKGNAFVSNVSDRFIEFNTPIGVIIGDSIAEGHKGRHGRLHLEDGRYDLSKENEPGQLSYHLEKLTDIKFVNQGIGGQRTDQILARWGRDVLAQTVSTLNPSKTLEYKPNLVVVNAGVNDVIQNIQTDTIINNLEQMMVSIEENKIYGVFNTIGYFNSVTPTQEQINSIDKINKFIKDRVVDSQFLFCFDYNEFVKGDIHGYPNESMLTDKIHPSKDTYSEMANEIYFNLLENNKIPFCFNHITISTKINPSGTFSGLQRPKQLIISYDDNVYKQVVVLANKEIVNIPIPDYISKPITKIKIQLTRGQVPNGFNTSTNWYISEVYGSNNCTYTNIIAESQAINVETLPNELAQSRCMKSPTDYGTDNNKLYGVTVLNTSKSKLISFKGKCIIESLEELNSFDHVKIGASAKITKATNFETDNIIAVVVQNANTENSLEYICELK